MTRITPMLVCAICLFGLSNFGSSGTSGQVIKAGAEDVAPPAKVEDKKVEDKRPVRPPQVAVEDAWLQQFEQQFGPQFRLMYRSELHFMRVVAEPTKQQFEKIAGDGDAAVKAAIRKYAMRMRGGGDQSDPRASILDAIAKNVRATLAPEQVDRYQKELDLRTAALKRTVVLNLVASIDRVLVLRRDQRNQLSDILSNNWNDSWNQTQILMYGGQYFPVMPDEKINPILTEVQQAVWRGVQKGNINFGFQLQFMQGIQIDDEVWDKK